MKKIIIAFVALVALGVGAFFVYQNLPDKRYARHLTKARLFLKQANYTAALKEYEQAWNAVGKFTPWVDMEVLRLTSTMHLQEKRYDQAMDDARAYLREHPRSREGNLHLARLAFQLGRYEPAFEAINELLAYEKDHYRGRLLLAQVRERQGRVDLAEEQYRILAEAHPESTDVLLPLARSLSNQRRYGESRALAKSILARNPADTGANLLLVEAWLQERRADSAAAALDAWQAADSSVLQPIAIQKARLYSMQGRNDTALAILRPLAEGSKPPVPVLAEIALIQVKLGQIDTAIKTYDAIIDQAPPNRGAFLVFTHLLHLAKKNAVRSLEILKTLEVGARDRVFHRSLIALYMAIGQEAKIDALIASESDSARPHLEAFRKGMVPDPDFIGGWALFNYYQMNEQAFLMLKVADSLYKRWPSNALIARTYAAQLSSVGALPQAVEVLNKIKPPTVEDLVRILEMNRRMGRAKEALAVAQRLEKQHPGAKGINGILSDIHLAQGNNDQAAVHAERELAIDTGNIVCVNNLAWIYGVIQGDFKKAEPYVRRLERVKNSDPRILDTIGWILAKTGRLADAEPYFKLALNILPDNPALLYHYGYLKHKQGDKAQATELVKKALSLKRAFQEKPDAEKLLAELG